MVELSPPPPHAGATSAVARTTVPVGAPARAPASSSRFASFRLRRPRVLPAAAPFWQRFAFDVARGCLAILLLHWFVLQISIVRGHSMEPSLADGDRLVVDRLCYCMGPVERFDVVVLRSPTDPSVDYVKRVIGVPGDRVRIEHGLVLVNDEPLESGFEHIDDRAQMDERRVPHDSCFVLGDNRPVSCDSREFGLVPLASVKGKVRARFWPFSRMSLFP